MHEELAHMHAPPTLFWYPAFCFPAIYNPFPTWGVPCNQLTEEETLGPGCRIRRHYPEEESSSRRLSLWDILKDCGEGKSSQWTEPQQCFRFICVGKRSLVYAVFLPLLCLLKVGLGARTLYYQEVKKPHNLRHAFGGITFLVTIFTSDLLFCLSLYISGSQAYPVF